MPNPFAALTPALLALATEGRVLPATGQALVDLAATDTYELYDRLTGGDRLVQGLWERPSVGLYRSVSAIGRRQRHLFRYFIDGSTKTYFIGTLLEHERSSPVQIAQVGAAGVFREDDGRLRVVRVQRKLALLLDRTMLSDVLWERLQGAVAGVSDLVVRNTGEQDEYTAISANEPRSRGAHKANWMMRESERWLVKDGLGEHGSEDWLILDGALGNEYLDWRGSLLIGVAKSFRRDSIFQWGEGPRGRQINLYSLLAGLEEGQRTAVFPRRRTDGDGRVIAFWYVRLRPQRGLDYPLMGVVKVEVPCPGGEPVPAELADLISSCLVAERSVTPHGRDSRWHAHLYPISIAERVIQDSFYSEEVLKAAIKWPERRNLVELGAR